MANKASLTKKLSEIRESKRGLGIKIGQMATTPRSDPNYSPSRMEGRQREVKDLDEKEAELLGQLLELEGGTVEVGTPAPTIEPEAKIQNPADEEAIKKAAKEIEALSNRCDKRALDITKEVYKLVELCQSQEDDWKATVALVSINPDELSTWRIELSFPMVTLLKDLITVQRRIQLIKPELLEKTGLPPVW
jgi:ribosomal protein L16 Arg81 hydroxylase